MRSTEDTNEIQPSIIKGAKSWSEVTNEAVKMSQKEYTTGMNQIKIYKSTEIENTKSIMTGVPKDDCTMNTEEIK